MLNQIATIFEAAVDRTNLVEQYDGVVKRVTSKGETFPVSCTDPTACNNDHYRKAIPNQDLRGLAYVEQRGSGRVGAIQSWGYEITYPVRLVLWINAGKQSLSNCSDVISQAELNIINCLKTKKGLTVDFSSKQILARVDGFSILSKEPGEIFQGLAYNDKAALYVWPYAYTAIDCNVIFQIPSGCILAVEPTTEDECVEY